MLYSATKNVAKLSYLHKRVSLHIQTLVFEEYQYSWLILYAQLHYFLNFSQLLLFLSAIIGQID